MNFLPYRVGKEIAQLVLHTPPHYTRSDQRELLEQAWASAKARTPERLEQAKKAPFPRYPAALRDTAELMELVDNPPKHRLLDFDISLTNRQLHKWRAYYVRCRCGNERMLTATEILQRLRLGLGCASVDCEAAPFETKVWYSLEAAMRLQVVQAYAICKPYRESLRPGDTVDSETRAWCRRYAPFVTSPGKHWFSRLRDLAPYSADFGWYPKQAVFKDGQVNVLVEEELLTVREVAWALDVPEELILDLKLQMWDDKVIDEALDIKKKLSDSKEQDVVRFKPQSVGYENPRKHNKKRSESSGRPDRVSPFYNDLAVQYNSLPLYGCVTDGRRGATLSNLNNVLKHRGLVRDTDYLLHRVRNRDDGTSLPKELRVLVIKKISDKPMRVL